VFVLVNFTATLTGTITIHARLALDLFEQPTGGFFSASC